MEVQRHQTISHIMPDDGLTPEELAEIPDLEPIPPSPVHHFFPILDDDADNSDDVASKNEAEELFQARSKGPGLLFPIRYPQVRRSPGVPTPRAYCQVFSQMWNIYKKARGLFWTSDHMDLTADVLEWEISMTEPQHALVMHAICTLYNQATAKRATLASLGRNITPNEAQHFFAYQTMMYVLRTNIQQRHTLIPYIVTGKTSTARPTPHSWKN